MEWVFVYVLGFRLKFSRIAASRKRLQLESKTDLTTAVFFWKFLLEYASFPRLNICMDCNLHELRSCHSFFEDIMFFAKLVEGYSALFFKNACTV